MPLAKYAVKGDFDSDIDQIIYSNPFKRLANKSQIIIKPTRDHFRSRLIHTEEVNRIALDIAKGLDLNLSLITAISMAHDLGHTPFGHAGEKAIQTILERELLVRFQVKITKNKREEIIRKIFHHSLNSVRLLLKGNEFEGISKKVIVGILTHSWSPWKKICLYDIPNSYEGQVVAIADQIASINHDTEDIIEGEPYTEYNFTRFKAELINGFKKSYPDSFKNLDSKISNFIEDKLIESGYGRKRRIKNIIEDLVYESKRKFKNNNINNCSMAYSHPLNLSYDLSNFIRYYENFIRRLIQQKIPWFIGRDCMAAALISTVFNHLWSRVRITPTVSQMKLPLFNKKDLIKTKIETKEMQYLDHFKAFYKEHYKGSEENQDFYSLFLKETKESNFKTWDCYILNNLISKKLSENDKEKFSRLIAVIDFIAGLTDRYCLEIFNQVYKEFLLV